MVIGHESSSCPKPKSSIAKQCYKCKTVGHIQSECPNAIPTNHSRRHSVSLNTVQCFNCGQSGHVFKQCPYPQIVTVCPPIYPIDFQLGVTMINPYYLRGLPSPQYGGFTGPFDVSMPVTTDVQGIQTGRLGPICYSCSAPGHKVR